MPDTQVARLRDSCESLLAQLVRSPASVMSAPELSGALISDSLVEPELYPQALDCARRLGERYAASQGTVQDLIGQLLAACQTANALDRRQQQRQQEAQQAILSAGVKAYLDGVTRRLTEQAQRDPLTKLFNRTFFDEQLQVELTRARRYQRELTLVLFDLDQFKQVNDQHGHPRGDEVLQQFARLLQSSMRQSDLAFRYGGDEFAALLPETGMAAVQHVLERLERQFHDLRHSEPRTSSNNISSSGLSYGLSYGVAAFPQDAASALELVKLADARLYECKRAHQQRQSARPLPAEGQR